MKIWRISSLALAIAVAFPLPAAAQSNANTGMPLARASKVTLPNVSV
jgi:hypothetical protein